MAEKVMTKVSSKKPVQDSMGTDSSDAKMKKRALQDKMNRAPEFNKGINEGKRKRNSYIET